MHFLDRRQMQQLSGMDPELEHRFRELLGRDEGLGRGSGVWSPPADVLMDEEGLLIMVELAGIQRDDIRLALDDQTLVIRGSRHCPAGEDNREYSTMELSFGTFERTFRLAEGLDTSRVDANYKDGFLKIRIPRQAGRTRR
jgi:HSP20 family protein